MSSIQALREQRAAIAKTLKDQVGKKDWNPAVDQPIYDAGIAQVEHIDAQIARIETVNALAVEASQTEQIAERSERVARDHNNPYAAVYAKWLRGGDKALTAEDHAVIRNTMSTTTGSEGGYTVPTEVAGTVLDALKAFGGMRAGATTLVTASGNPMSYPTSDGTSEVGEIVAENGVAADADLTFGTKDLPVYKYSSKVVTVPIELLMDSTVDVEAFVAARLVTRLGRITNTHFTTGTGSSQPNGLITASGTGKTGASGQTLTVTYDDLVDLVHSVDPAYRDGGACQFMMNDSSVKIIKKLKDGEGRPVFLPAYDLAANGKLDQVLGYSIIVNQSVAAMAANAKSIAFGDLSKYVIRDCLDIVQQRFTDSAYAKKGQVGFLAWLRSGGNLMDVGGAVKLYVNSAS